MTGSLAGPHQRAQHTAHLFGLLIRRPVARLGETTGLKCIQVGQESWRICKAPPRITYVHSGTSFFAFPGK